MRSESEPQHTAAMPSGSVTFLFTDIEGSTQRWEQHHAAMEAAVKRHDELLRAEIERHHGYVFKTVGDAFCAVFDEVGDAVAAAIDAQRQLAKEDFSSVDGIRVRMGVHTGQASERGGDYFGPDVNRVARLTSIGHGCQVLLSGAVQQIFRDQIPSDATLIDLGLRRLKDLTKPEQVWQLQIAGLPGDFPPLTSLDARANNLPIQATSLLGRETDLEELKLLAGKHRLLTLTGAGGIGKTRLVLAIAADLIDRFADGVWFADLAPISDPALVASVVAKTVGIAQTKERKLEHAITQRLKRKQLILIIDNCEHVIEATATLAAAILGAALHVRILATSRQPLNIDGECIYRLRSLSSPEATAQLSAQQALSYGAVALFNDRATASNPAFVLTDDNAPTIADICRHLDGIPLAIELAAARVKVLSIPNLAHRLSERFKILTDGRRTALPRQKTLAALIDWSYELLGAAERILFQRVAIFAGGFSLEAATAVCASDVVEGFNVLDLVSALADKSLIVADTTGGRERYRLLESIRAYALEKLTAGGERERLSRRAAEYFLAEARAEDVRYGAGSTPGWLARMELDLDNYRAALTWSLDQGNDAVLGGTLVGALADFWLYHGLNVEGRRWVDTAFRALGEHGPDNVAASLWFARCILSDGRQSRDAAQRAFELYERLGDERGMIAALHSLGIGLYQLGQLETSEAVLRRSVRLANDIYDERGAAYSKNALAYVLGQRGDIEGARQCYEDVLSAHARSGDEGGRAIALRNRAEFEFVQGNPPAAILHGNEALAIELRGKNLGRQAWCYANLAAYRVALGQLEDAQSCARSSLLLARELQREFQIAVGIQHLALIESLMNDIRRAARLLGYADKWYREGRGERELTEKWSYVTLMRRLSEHLTENEIRTLLAEGAAWSEDQAVEEALKV